MTLEESRDSLYYFVHHALLRRVSLQDVLKDLWETTRRLPMDDTVPANLRDWARSLDEKVRHSVPLDQSTAEHVADQALDLLLALEHEAVTRKRGPCA